MYITTVQSARREKVTKNSEEVRDKERIRKKKVNIKKYQKKRKFKGNPKE